jgi:hypothetical protein
MLLVIDITRQKSRRPALRAALFCVVDFIRRDFKYQGPIRIWLSTGASKPRSAKATSNTSEVCEILLEVIRTYVPGNDGDITWRHHDAFQQHM